MTHPFAQKNISKDLFDAFLLNQSSQGIIHDIYFFGHSGQPLGLFEDIVLYINNRRDISPLLRPGII